MCPCPGDSGAISTELGRLPRSSRSLRTALRFPSPAVSRTAQLRPCYDQQPRGDDTDRRQGVALARLPSSRRPRTYASWPQPQRFAWCSRLSICARFSNHGNPGPLDRPAVM
uniref:Uncharacterized protein n=1 Tax=Oryza rufipogon TaxID=4529 RepID=A0A0E0R6V1_ORYRU